uniref:Uncharacterized protein LOC108044528 n=1 Tax=Drosophila rhopaloa TaxID=1041015 RepID=A0A6P4EQX9_DRORH
MSKSILIVGTLLVTIFIGHLPVGQAVTCADDPDDAACIDCTAEANVDNAECTTTTVAPEVTTAAAEVTTAAAAADSATDSTTASSTSTTKKMMVIRKFKRTKTMPKNLCS